MADKKSQTYAQGVDVQELSEGELKFGYWYVTHKEAIRKFTIISLIVFSVLTFGYALFSTIRFYGFRYEAYTNAINTSPFDYVNVIGVHQSNQIQDIQIISRDAFQSSTGKIDLVARVVNPNSEWALKSFKYQFAIGGVLTEEQEGYVLPGEEKYVMLLNIEGRLGTTPQLLINDRVWQRVIVYDEWGPARLNFKIEDKKFLTPRQGEISERLPVSEVTATITNDTPFNYNDIEIQVGLSSGNRLLSVNRITLQDFLSGQVRPISARWTQTLPPVSDVEIIVTVNLVDETVYQDFEGTFDPALIEFDARGRRIR